MRDGLDLGRGPDGLVGCDAALGVDQVRSKDGVDERRFPETGLSWKISAPLTKARPGKGVKAFYRTDTDDVELKTALQELPLDLRRDAVEPDMTSRVHEVLRGRQSIGRGCHCRCRNGDLVSRTGWAPEDVVGRREKCMVPVAL